MNNNGGELRVEDRGAERVFETANEDRLIDKSIQWPSEATPLCGKGRPPRCRRPSDDQYLEIRPLGIRAPQGGRQHIRWPRLVALVCIPIAVTLPERPSEDGTSDTTSQGCGRMRVICCDVFSQGLDELKSGIGVEFLRRRHLGERCLDFGSIACAVRPSFG